MPAPWPYAGSTCPPSLTALCPGEAALGLQCREVAGERSPQGLPPAPASPSGWIPGQHSWANPQPQPHPVPSLRGLEPSEESGDSQAVSGPTHGPQPGPACLSEAVGGGWSGREALHGNTLVALHPPPWLPFAVTEYREILTEIYFKRSMSW